jgi:hypothetical protein
MDMGLKPQRTLLKERKAKVVTLPPGHSDGWTVARMRWWLAKVLKGGYHRALE